MLLSYFSGLRSGKSHIRNLALYNKQTVSHTFQCHYRDGSPFTTVVFEPLKNTQTWYWDNKTKTIECDYNIDYVKLMNDQKKRPRPTHWLNVNLGRYNAPFESGTTPPDFYKSFPKSFECDWILDPLPLLGYIGKHTMNDDLRKDNRLLTIDLDYSIEQFKKRRNIIPFKEDIRHMARQWFLGSARYDDDFIANVHDRLKKALKFAQDVKIMLNRFDIRYEDFSLDTGDYTDLGFTKLLPRRSTDDIDTYIPDKYINNVDTWVNEFLED